MVPAPIRPAFYLEPKPDTEAAWVRWLTRYAARVAEDDWSDADRAEAMNHTNPLYVLRNYIAQEAIELAEEGDLSRLHRLQDILRDPYTERPGLEAFAQKRPEWARHKPGCSMLSCSS